MTGSPEVKRKRALVKLGASGKLTKIFDDLGESAISFFRTSGLLDQIETPILGFFEDSRSWVLLASDKLFFSTESGKKDLLWSEVQEIGLPAQSLQRLADDPASKMKIQYLEVLTTSGDRFTLKVEPGEPFFGIWNAMRILSGPFGG